MIAELGHFCLVLAFALSALQAGASLFGAQKADAGWMQIGARAAGGQFIMLAVAFFALMTAYLQSDFSVQNVWANSHSLKPTLYKIAGTWGNHEGSMLLWVLVLAAFGLFLSRGALMRTAGAGDVPDDAALHSRAVGVQGILGFLFIGFVLITSNPFLRLDPVPFDGQDLNPLLQDPALAAHPPMLYLGYVGFSSVYSCAVAALWTGQIDKAWATWVRPYVQIAWAALTVGIALGSWWAYYELGWGGWWFWDPVENASFMPWLAGTALLHTLIVLERREAMKSWTVLLAILTFGLSLLGTFLVRSGVLTSVHSFADAPGRGFVILMILALTVGAGLALYAARTQKLKAGQAFAPQSREGFLVLNNLFLGTACATVLIGTLYPILAQAFGVDLAVSAPYFNLTFLILMTPLLLVVPLGAALAWRQGDLKAAFRRLRWAGGLAVLGGALAVAFVGGPVLAGLGVALAVWLVAGTLADLIVRLRTQSVKPPLTHWAMVTGHLGLAVLVLGVTGASAWKVEDIVSLRPGEAMTVAGTDIRFDGIEAGLGPNYRADVGTFTLLRDGEPFGTLRSEKRFYPVARQPTTEVGIQTSGLADLYVALGAPQPDGSWAVRAYRTPLVPLIWFGAVIMALAGMIGLAARVRKRAVQKKTAAPVRSRPVPA